MPENGMSPDLYCRVLVQHVYISHKVSILTLILNFEEHAYLHRYSRTLQLCLPFYLLSVYVWYQFFLLYQVENIYDHCKVRMSVCKIIKIITKNSNVIKIDNYPELRGWGYHKLVKHSGQTRCSDWIPKTNALNYDESIGGKWWKQVMQKRYDSVGLIGLTLTIIT